MTKLKFLWVLLALLVGGVNGAWADATYEYKYSPALNTSGYFTVSSTENFSGFPSNTVQVDAAYITGATKMGKTTVTFTTSAASSTVYVGIYIKTENENTFTFDNADKSLGTSGSATAGTYGLVTIENVAAGSHTIKKTSGNEVELYYVKVVEHNYSYPDATVQTYPHTWDFTKSSADWGTTSTQVVNYDDWDGSGTYFHTGTAGTTRGFNIDVLKGLRCQSYWLGVDWGYGHIYVTAGSITIPSVPAGYGIIFTMEGRQGLPNNAVATTMTTSQATPASATINPTESSHTTYTFDVASAGDVTFNFNGAISIKSIAVTPNTFTGVYTPHTTTDLQIGTPNNNIYILDGDDKERTLKGTYTFTGPGRIAGGTVIDEVPGITLTVGASGDSWDVVEGNGDVNPDFKKTENNQTWNIGYVAVCKTAPNTRPGATSGCFYTFKALVNGELTIHYYTRSGAYVYNGNTSVTSNNENRIQDITFKVEAGKTYTLEASTGTDQKPSEGIIWLNSFTFTPMFFHPGTTTNQRDYDPAVFPANMNTDKSAFPKLINPSSTEQQNKVKFAGDKEKVYLYKNNDVDLLAAGTNILIRGTVLDKNNEDGLVAYYYLNSYVLTVSSYEQEDQAYIATDGLEDDNYQIVFSGNVQPASGSGTTVTVQVQKDNGTPYNVTASTYANEPNLFIPFATLDAGATYRITVPANAIALTANADTKNSKIERTFSVNAPGEAQVKMIYPTGLATVGTTIVLETYLNGTVSNVNNSHKVKGILSDGTTVMEIDATFGTQQLAFKPTSTLKSNTTYTLTIPETYNNKENHIYLTEEFTPADPDNNISAVYYQVTHSKVFTFTTGSSSGTAPYVIANGTAPAEGATIPGTAYSGGTISFTFDQKVELEPYSTVNATPINGREATASGTTRAPGAENSLTVGSDGKTVSFNYETDGLKYDMYYEVVIPANTVVGAGGLPNASPITLHFRMGTNPNATPVNASSFYPHTWDFNKFGDHTASGTTAYNLVNNCGDPKTAEKRINSLYRDSDQSYTIYKTKAQAGYGFDQGNDVYFNNINGEKEVMDEFEGIRISLVSSRSDRFEIRDVTSNGGSTNADGTKKWQFRMNGNTHYMALSNVPAGKLYMVVGSNALIGINSPNAHFVEDDKFLATTHESNTKITNTNGTKKLVLNVTEAGDVTFCLANFTCDKIAVAGDEKTFKSGYAESGNTYATDRLTYDVRYDLLNAFTDHIVKAYYVTDIVDNAEDNTATINAREVTYSVAGANKGVIVLYQGEVSADTSVPVFKTDVNSAEQSGQTNELKVIESNTTTVPTPADDCYMYVLSNKGSKSDGVAFYRYTGNTFSDRAAYLEVPKYMVNPSISGGSARVFRMVFYNEDGSETTVIRTVEKDGVTEKAEQAGGYYDLRGQRLAKPNKRGLYIKNGKKVYVK